VELILLVELEKRGIEIAAEEEIRVRPEEIQLVRLMPKILGEVARRSNQAMVPKLLKTRSSDCTST
jgi:hypothetical protein